LDAKRNENEPKERKTKTLPGQQVRGFAPEPPSGCGYLKKLSR